MLADKSSINGEFKVASVRQSNHDMPVMHYHDFYEIYIQDEGTRDCAIGNNFYKLNPRDIVLIKPNVLHQSLSSNTHSRTVIYFTESFLKKYFSAEVIQRFIGAFQSESVTLSSDSYYKISKIIRDMKKDSDLNSDNLIFAKFAEIFVLILKSIREQPTASLQSSRVAAESSVNQGFSPLIAYVHENFLSLTSIDEIASTFYVTPSHLCRTFKKLTNYTIIQYINLLKIQKSCAMLHDTNKSITDIALDCGFNSTMYFCKTFRSLLHLTPTEYRRNIKESISS
ncbi:MAG TPA: AraC family transcriptional regulator [Candidatus Hungatella pullicola]|nr:AraC family transcriptional regulator [Candidatus Hungatella pullicola]